MTQDHTELLDKIAKGCPTSEQKLVEMFQSQLLTILCKRTGDPDLAHDLRQEVFIATLKRLRNTPLEDPGKLPNFILATASNMHKAHIRRTRSRKTDSDEDAVLNYIDTALDQHSRIEQRELRAEVSRYVDQLKHQRDREILRLHYLEDRDKTEVCLTLDLSPEHFSRVIFRAKQRLRDVIVEIRNEDKKRK